MRILNVGIDLGSASIKVFVQGVGLIANVKSVVAVNRETGMLIDFGMRAYKMIGRAPKNVEVITPLVNGVVKNFKLTQMLISEILRRIVGVSMKRVRLFVCVHNCETEFEKVKLVDSVFSGQINDIFLVSEPVASGFGAGFDLNNSEGLVLVNVGSGTVDMAYVEARQVVRINTVKIGGQTIDCAIKNQILKKYGLSIGILSAEKLKIQAVSLENLVKNNFRKFKISGKDRFSNLPKSLWLTSQNVYDLISDTLSKIASEIVDFVCELPCSFCVESQLILAGGTSLISGFAEYLAKRLRLKISVVNDPISCAVFGLSELFKSVDLTGSSFVQSA